ncbi:TPA: BppU family phage baseplate upper protein [Clostridium perfringens]|uniref:BppU family phage baseplate upper protein n=1 Tax=Clostridium perfringens TaxID=1502 RepID=A0A8H9R0G8_CLOPF|nr:BppU family phage baseplate upper protein [Clostridium perfringens]
MKEIFINVDFFNSEGIKTIQGNNNAETYKICILKSKVRLSLVGKTVKLGYVMAGTTKGDIIEDLNITNAEQGEITLPITNKISKKDGIYTCELAIYGADEFLEYTATFGLTVQANIFTKIAGEIADTKDLTYIESILEEAKKVSRDLKTNIPVATNLNISLESNISNARNINTTLVDTTEKSKVAATDAIEKKSQLESSITKAKEFIDGLDGSQDIPGMRMELTELQNGLKSNQALSYEGSSISAENTLEGRTEGMKIKGRTLQNLFYANQSLSLTTKIGWINSNDYLQVVNEKYTLVNNTDLAIEYQIMNKDTGLYKNTIGVEGNSIVIYTLKENEIITRCEGLKKVGWTSNDLNKLKNTCYILKGDWTDKPIPNFFEDIKSFGEAEQEGDKYKISILSTSSNIFDYSKFNVLSKKYYLENGSLGDSNDWSAIEGFIDVFNFKNLTINKGNVGDYGIAHILCYNSTQNLLGKCVYILNSKPLKITLLPSTRFIKFCWRSVGNNVITDMVICPSHVDSLKFSPYKCDKKDILIKEPLRSVSDVKDVMYEDNGQVKIDKYVKEYTFTGDEDITISVNKPSSGNYLRVFFQGLNNNLKQMQHGNLLCTTLPPKNLWNIPNEEGISITQGIDMQILKSKLTSPDVQGFKAWLKANPTTIVYQLATPTIEIVENCVDIDLDTYQEKTYFNILNSLPGSLDFKVPSNLGSSLQNLAKEVNNIWDVINNLLVPSIVKANGNLAMLKLNNNLN